MMDVRGRTTGANRLDPRAKLVAGLLLAGAILGLSGWLSLVSSAVALLSFFVAADLVKSWLRLLRSVWFVAAIVLMLDSLSAGPVEGAITAAKFLLLISLFSAFFLSTDPDDLALALISMKVPYTFGFILATSARHVPIVREELREISDAFAARGISRGGTPIGRFRFYAAILAPLVVATIRRSLRLSEALEARAFGASSQRTSLRQIRLSRCDALFIASVALGFGILVAAHFTSLIPGA